jgi:uncharacterized protein YbaP (TraB family)
VSDRRGALNFLRARAASIARIATRVLRAAGAGALSAVLLASIATAQPAPDCPPAARVPDAAQWRAAERDARDRGFLWRIGRDGHDSYLYGTLHVAKLEWMAPGPAVRGALAASDTVALEIDLTDAGVQARMAQERDAGADADTPLPEALRERLRRQARAECVSAEFLERLSPTMQITVLASLAGRRDGLDPAYGIDAVLAAWGHATHRTVVSLETVELQLGALREGDDAPTAERVAAALDELESGAARPAIGRIAQMWADSDLATLDRYETWCECMDTPADRAATARLLDERNPALADRIAALHAGGARVFAGVGSLHMTGPQGLPAQMARRGFRVERVVFAR